MPKQPRGSASITDTLERWKREGEEIEQGLRDRLAQLEAETEIVEQALVNFEARRAVRSPATRKPRAAAVVEAPAPAGEASGVEVELLELKPLWGQLKEQTRKVVEMRAAGKKPREISAAAGLPAQSVSGRVYAALVKLRAARQAGGAAAAGGKADAGDEWDGKSSSPAPARAASAPAPATIERAEAIREAAERLRRPPPAVRIAPVVVAPKPAIVVAPNALNASPRDALPAPLRAVDPKHVVGARVVCRLGHGPERIGTIVAPGNRPDLFRVGFGSGKSQMLVAEEILRVAPQV